jgi:hypothetical protein
MPQFTPWNVTSPEPNILYNPAAVDKSIADVRSTLGTLDLNRQKFEFEKSDAEAARQGGQRLLDSLGGGGTAPPADATPFEQQMGAAEGGGTADKVNAGGYAGQFQFGAGRLADLGLYTPAQGEDLKSNQWKGSFHIAPYNVTNLQDFLANPAAQHAAFVAHVADIDKTIDATPGADKFDRNGLRAVAHLGGTRGMQRFIASGGTLNSADSNGTTLGQYYRKFAAGGPAMLQQSFGSVHGRGGPPSDLPAVQPGGNATAWIDPNAPLPVPPIPPAFNANAGPRAPGSDPSTNPNLVASPGTTPAITPIPAQVSDRNGIAVPTPVRMPDPGAAPVQTSAADPAAVAVSPSPIALRTGGTDVAGPGAGPDALPPVDAPNRLYETGLPGIQIRGPTNGLAPPPVAAQAPAAPPAAPGASAPPGATGRPPVVQPPPALQRAIPPPQTLPSGLTAGDTQIVAAMVQARTPTAQIATFIESARQRNTALQQQYLSNSAAVDQANFERQRQYRADQIEAEKTAYQRQQDAETARRNAATDARAEAAARNAGLPPGYRMDDKGVATRMDGLPPDPAVAEAAKADYEKKQRQLPFQGNAQDAQDRNILITGDPKSPEYHSAYASYADPKTQEGGLVVKHNMQPYRMPQDQEGNPITTYDQPNISIGPGDLTKLRAFETGATTLKAALDDFAKTSRNASFGERTATALGQPTDLSAAWTNAALMAKGTALYELGVLSGPDMTVLRGALADPSTFMGRVTSNETIDKQVARIKALLDTRVDQARRSYGGGMGASGPAASATPPPKAERPPLASFAR